MKTARQFFRAVKNWGVGDEVKCTRREFTRYRRAERKNKAPWMLNCHPFTTFHDAVNELEALWRDEPALEPHEPTEVGE